MLQIINTFIILLTLAYLTFSCTTAQEKRRPKLEVTDSTSYNKTVLELTPVQQSAFDALNRLQVNTDERNQFYSTFSNIVQPCYPADTNFVITQSEFLVVMKQFISKHCKMLSAEIQNELAVTSVLAQDKYKVLHCRNDLSSQNYENGLPMYGTWVMPNVLGRRDVILEW